MVSNRSRLESGRVEQVCAEILADLDNVLGWSFEQCCRRWLEAYADEDTIGAPRQIGSWWARNGGLEVDVVGVRKHRYVLVGSCKWRRTADLDVLEDLRLKQGQLGPRASSARCVIFAREGFTEALRAQAARENVLLISAADLFA